MEKFELGNRILYYLQTKNGGLISDIMLIIMLGSFFHSLSGKEIWICAFLIIFCVVDLVSITIYGRRVFMIPKYLIIQDTGFEIKQSIFPKEEILWEKIESVEICGNKILINHTDQARTKIDISELFEMEVRNLDAVLYRYCYQHQVEYHSTVN